MKDANQVLSLDVIIALVTVKSLNYVTVTTNPEEFKYRFLQCKKRFNFKIKKTNFVLKCINLFM